MQEGKNTAMTSVGELLIASMAKPEGYHVPSEPGDFVDADGYLCCGKCLSRKEHRGTVLGHQVVNRCMCQCEALERAKAEEAAKRNRELQTVRELAAFSLTDERFRQSTFDRFKKTAENGKALSVCRRYVEHFAELYANGTGLLLYGSPGTGKTFAAACIANALMAQGVPVLVTSIVKLTSYGMFSEDLQVVLRKMKSARLLVLDDLGAERNTDFKAEQIFDVIDTRYNTKKPMIITTNIAMSDMKNDMDIRRRRVYDRIIESCHPVKMDWQSFRVETARAQYARLKSLLEGEE